MCAFDSHTTACAAMWKACLEGSPYKLARSSFVSTVEVGWGRGRAAQRAVKGEGQKAPEPVVEEQQPVVGGGEEEGGREAVPLAAYAHVH